ncbi:uncharacterized protein LOC109203509 [Oreochromis niloticus]|uniref:uncharacterized protein LOC109203509 n=1 Tax=Oreochromis niloticus TaxID=8128 RepID=UPI00090512C5|nr:uncharacterized protein LOC109203509 [Oreochromis niloticus]
MRSNSSVDTRVNSMETQSLQKTVAESVGPSSDSMKSDRSKMEPPIFRDQKSKFSQKSVAHPSCVSIKSDRSKMYSLHFKDEKSKCSQSNASGSAAPSKMSLTERSKFEPLGFEMETRRPVSEKPPTCPGFKDVMRDPVQLICEHSCKLCLSTNLNQPDSPADNSCPECGRKSWKIPKHKRDKEPDTNNIPLLKVKMKLKEAMKKKFSSVSEGNGDNTSSLNSIYTELHITTGERERPSVENVFRLPEQKSKSSQSSKQQIINLNKC